MNSMWHLSFTGAARALTLALGLAALAACGGKGTVRPDATAASDSAPSSRGTPEERVKHRAVTRWEMLIDKRYDEAYGFLSPGYREVRPREDYVKIMQGRPVQWTRVFHKDSKCDGESCIVDIEVHAQLEMPVMRVGTVDTLTVLKENWILSDGEWYLVPSADR
jgi:predicted small lipoprotein YifL